MGLVVIVTIGLSGCGRGLPQCAATGGGEYVLAEARARATTIDPPPEITPSPALASLRSEIKTAAVRVPDGCEATCYAWTRALERALAQAGYRVVSSEAVKQTEKASQAPAHVAAKELGAEVVFVFQTVAAQPAQTQSTLEFFSSDEHGDKRGQLPLTQRERASFETAFAMHARAPTATAQTFRVEGAAIATTNGEILLSYRRVATQSTSDVTVAALFVTNRTDWAVVRPDRRIDPTPPAPPKSADDVLFEWALDLVAKFHG